MIVVFFVFCGFCGGENGTSWEVACEKLADATVFENGFVGCRKVEGGCAGYGIWDRFGRWGPVNGSVKGTIEPCYVRVFQPVNTTLRGGGCRQQVVVRTNLVFLE
jgi:hypothetical protein